MRRGDIRHAISSMRFLNPPVSGRVSGPPAAYRRENAMKHRYLSLVLLLSLAACNQASTPPIAAPVATQRQGMAGDAGCPGGLKGGECDAYKDGVKAGIADRAAHQGDSFRRHEGEFDPRFEASYRAGYATGWYNNGK